MYSACNVDFCLQDAELALEYEMDGIVVSNHGGCRSIFQISREQLSCMKVEDKLRDPYLLFGLCARFAALRRLGRHRRAECSL